MSVVQDKSLEMQVRYINRILKGLDQEVGKRIMRRAIRVGMAEIQQAIQLQIPEKYKHLREYIGARLAKNKVSKTHQAKVGSAVGFSARKMKEAKSGAKRDRPGVGITAQNIHWIILGTGKRTTGEKRRKNRRTKEVTVKDTGNRKSNRGSMPALLKNVVKDGFASSSGSALKVMQETTRDSIARYVRKVARDAASPARELKKQAREFAKAARSAKLKKIKLK